MEKNENILEIKNLTAGYKTKKGMVRAVDDVSFTLKKGEFLGIAGESGCGKSTLAFAVMNLMRDNALIESGSVNLNGLEISSFSMKQMNEIRWVNISMVFQSAMNSLNPVLSIGKQLQDAVLSHKNISQTESMDICREYLKLVDIPPERINNYPHQLSGGMRQRVMIAMALLLQPDLVIMDEPTTALDVVVQRTIIEKIIDLKDKFNFSVIFITHDLSLLVEICDTLSIMYAGRIIETGSAKDLFFNPRHPYTIGLMNSFPSLTGEIKRMGGIEGKPPDLLNPPEGCRFFPRCSKALQKCSKSYPAFTNFENDHRTACFLFNGEEGEMK